MILEYVTVVQFDLIGVGTYEDRMQVAVEITKGVVFLLVMLVMYMINNVDVANQVGIVYQDVYQIRVADIL